MSAFRDSLLSEEYDSLVKRGHILCEVPDYIQSNLNPRFKLRPYQREAIARFIYYMEKEPRRPAPTHLLFNMATGSGKTLIMAATMLYLYRHGYYNFLFFVNSTNIIEKTRDNFLNPGSIKYLFNDKIRFGERVVRIREVPNFEGGSEEDINMVFTTVQGLHSQLGQARENSLTYEDFADKKIVLISDEAHHINAWTRKSVGKKEMEIKSSWEGTVMRVLNSNPSNIMLEFTATIDLENPAIYRKYRDKIIYQYDLRRFRIDGYSKDIMVFQSDLGPWERMLIAVIFSQYRRKIAERHRIRLKPVVLFKSKSIKDSVQNHDMFIRKISELGEEDLNVIRDELSRNGYGRIFRYFDSLGLSSRALITELKEDFSPEKCLLIDSENIDREKQLLLNTLEDEHNEIRAIFAVNMLNEGWDVLNLFDIVRLYNTRDSKNSRPGKTTLAEAQLIGRGARYYPFRYGDMDPYRRKFDSSPDAPLRIIEELHYHSEQNSNYISELLKALEDSGIMSTEKKVIELRVKDSEFIRKGYVFLNRKVRARQDKFPGLEHLSAGEEFVYHLASGAVRESAIFDGENELQVRRKTIKKELMSFGPAILRKAMDRLEFYRFSNLKKYFPGLRSSSEFIDSLGKIEVKITSTPERLENITAEDMLEIAVHILREIEKKIKNNVSLYRGTESFHPVPLGEIAVNKKMQITPGDGEYGIPMSMARDPELRLVLKNRDWYLYEENYGTSEEKRFIKTIDSIMNELKSAFEEVYLLKNATHFKIYRFSDARAMEPDFVLFAIREKNGCREMHQIFVEVKGEHLVQKDAWKEQFLLEIDEKGAVVEPVNEPQNTRVLLHGMPFYNREREREFIRLLKEKLGIGDGEQGE